MTDRRPVESIVTDIHNLLGHRCREACPEHLGCRLDDGTAATYTVTFRVDDSSIPALVGMFAMSMCNDCVIDTRAALADDIERIRLHTRGVRP